MHQKLVCRMVAGSLLWVLCAGLSAASQQTLPVMHDAPASDRVTIAIIGEEETGFTDLLFAALANVPELRLVDRDELHAVMRESGLSGGSGKAAIEIGKLLRADALVLVNLQGENLYVRGVETARGVVFFQWAEEANIEAAEQSAAVVARILASRSTVLRRAIKRRHYVAVAPFVTQHKDDEAFAQRSQQFAALLPILLSSLPDVLIVERDALENLAFEQALDANMTEVFLQQADWILRGSAEQGANDELLIRLHFTNRTSGNAHYSEPFAIDFNNAESGLQTLLHWCAKTLSSDVDTGKNVEFSAEADIQYQIAARLFSRSQREAAMQSLRAAYMLNPDRYARPFATELWKGGGTLKAYAMMTEALDIIQFKLRSRECIFSADPPDSVHRNIHPSIIQDTRWARGALDILLRNLRVIPPDLTDEGDMVIAKFRQRFREYMEWLHLREDALLTEASSKWLQVVYPYFFYTVDDAIEYQKKLLTLGLLDLDMLRRSEILFAPQWDRKLAERKWIEFLEECILPRGGESSFISYVLRAEILLGSHPTHVMFFPHLNHPLSPEGVEASKELITWLSHQHELPKRYRDELMNLSNSIFVGFQHMDSTFQRKYMHHFFMQHAGLLSVNPLFYIEQRLYVFLDSIIKADPDDPELQAEVAEHLQKCIKAGRFEYLEHQELETMPLHVRSRTRRYIEKHFPLLGPLLPEAKITGENKDDLTAVKWHVTHGYAQVFDFTEDAPAPSIAGSKGVPQHPMGAVAADAFWVLFPNQTESAFLRVDAKTGETSIYPFSFSDVMGEIGNTRYPMFVASTNFLVFYGSGIRRVGGHPFPSIWVIPLDDVDNHPRFDETVKIEGLPTLRALNAMHMQYDDVTAGLRSTPTGLRRVYHQVTHLFVSDYLIYIALTPGMLYVWSPDMKEAQRVLCHDDMIEGPLTDTSPFVFAGARGGPCSSVNYFRIHSYFEEPKSGWYRYDPAAIPQWMRLEEDLPDELPRWRASSGGHWTHLEYLDDSNKTHRIARVRRFYPRPFSKAFNTIGSPVYQNAYAAFWLTKSEDSFRIYRSDRKDWDKATKQSNEP